MRRALVIVLLLASVACSAAQAEESERVVRIDLRHSHFTPDAFRVSLGSRVRFMIINHDPIDHELIIGPQEVHDRHSTGTEPWHPPVPGEVSIRAGEQAETSYVFDQAGVIVFACHLPRHIEYGMSGAVTVS